MSAERDRTDASAAAAARPCPICRKPSQQRWRPFCSKRCADVDLNRWLSGAYAIAAVESAEDDDEAPPPRRRADEDASR